MYNQAHLIDEREQQFIDQMVNEVYGETKHKSHSWVAKIFLLGMLLYVFSKSGKKTDKLNRIPDMDLSLDTLTGVVPLSDALKTVDGVSDVLPINAAQKRIYDLMFQNVAAYITNISDRTRKEIREQIIQAQLSKMHPQKLSHELYKRFKFLRKNWRLIACTENANIAAEGFMSMCEEGEKMTAHSLPDACPWCEKLLDGQTFIFTKNPPISDTDPKWFTHMWVGKTNVGRNRKDWAPSITLHPACRCYLTYGGK